MRIHLVIAAFLSLILVYLLLSATDDDPGSIAISSTPLSQGFDYFINRGTTWHFSATGQSDYTLNSTEMTHYPDTARQEEFASLTEPRFRIHRAEAAPWDISANKGRLDKDPGNDQERLLLNENVLAVSNSEADGMLRMSTSALYYYPQTEVSRTEERVRFTAPGMEIEGTGMYAELRQNRIRLLNDVEGHYDPSTTP